ncbi:hypothetical protein HG536_0A04520 [Torulaspora globosa]|uniref:Uncharacterized protein n=1 Tax=Torulaspora globosa TaxID=48254 RepID=A0A7G3ZAU9_9SACH|nr:uncharacterized protein HG536_0A04520 [Torulaspora globosa]QLL30635.1 hypothetical protein HG536_0A04520 [Torulaspora globosa]
MNVDNGGNDQNVASEQSNGVTDSNPFSNIGTPSFNLSQIPRNVLQNLTPAQVQMIQQRHRQLLMNRIQQQTSFTPPVQQSQPQTKASEQAQAEARARAQAQALAEAQTQARAQAQMQASQHLPQQRTQPLPGQQMSMSRNIPTNQPLDGGAAAQHAGMSRSSGGDSGSPQAPINLPPQIAQLPLPMQQQVLSHLKQQAIAKNNPAVVAAVTVAQQQLQQQLQQQQQQQHSRVPLPQPHESPASAQVQGQQNVPTQHALGSQIHQQQMPVVSGAPTDGQAFHLSQQNMNLPNAGPLPAMPKFDLPKYQTIKFDPPETKLPHPTFWSEQQPSTDTLLYEQIIQRDKANKLDLAKETNGYEPFSIYGFSNKEYLGKLWHTLKYYQELKATRMKSITNTSQNIPSASIWGDGYSGYGNGVTNSLSQVIPETLIDGRSQFYQDRLKIYEQAMNEESEELVPIRFEFDQERDKFFLRDTLLWNKHDSILKIEDFVDDMVRDYRYAPISRDQIAETISQTMKEQVAEYQSDPYLDLNQERPGGDDMRIKIKIDIVVGQHQLIDQFEWDISNTENCPEEFAESVCQELSLPGEFVTAIAHSIREQVHMYHKSLALLGYNFDGSVIDDDDIRSRMLPLITIDDVFRAPSEAKLYTPNLLQISAAELERLDKDKDRDARRKRRQGRSGRRGVVVVGNGGGSNSAIASTGAGGPSGANGTIEVSLPDVADIPRTFRTPIPSTILPGAIDLGPSVGSYDLSTTTEYKPRPIMPPAELQPCHIIDHIPGSSLLLCIKLPKSTRIEAEDLN